MNFFRPTAPLPSSRALALVLPLALAGCSDRALTGDDGDDQSETGTDTDPDTGDTGEPEPTDSGEPEPEPTDTGEPEPVPTDCEAACANPIDGGCLIGEACLETCASESPGWTAEIAEAFATCVAEDPLCFTTLDSCLLAQLHPPGTVYPLALTGAGFEAYEGATIEVLHDPDREPPFGGSATIVDGAFAFAWDEAVELFGASGPLLLAWIDVDGDELCTFEDRTSFVTLEWNGDLLAPAFAAEASSPFEANEFFCALLP